jgi:hypothetical protein
LVTASLFEHSETFAKKGHVMRNCIAVGMVVAILPWSGFAFGQVSWSDTFPGGVPQQSWTVSASGATGPSQTYGSGFTTLSASGAGAVLAFVGAPTFSSSQGITVRATLNPTQTTQNVANGVLAATNLGFGVAYTATITMGGSGFLEIQRNSFGQATQIASSGAAISGFSQTNSYILEMKIFENSSLIVANAYDSTGTTLLNSISAVDPSPLTGNFTAGILMQRNDAGQIEGTFANVSAVGVPEPGSVMLAAGGLGLLGLGGWRRSRAARSTTRS